MSTSGNAPLTPENLPTAVWSKSVAELAAELRTDPDAGLADDEIARRRELFGPNQLPEGEPLSPLKLFLSQFQDLMVVLLGVAAGISAVVGEWTDAILIAVIVVANAAIGFAQEWKAEQAVEALRSLTQPRARVRRGGSLREVATAELVPGDVVEIKSGDFVPADARLTEAVEFEVNESALTGESLPVEKNIAPCPADTGVPDRVCMIHSGTAVSRGHARGIVTHTGRRTELGQIAQLLETAKDGATPLQRRLASLNRWLAIAVIIISIIIFALGVMREPYSAWNTKLFSRMLLVAVSLAVAAIPEGLPAVITITLALGSQRMAKRQAIIRRLSAVESLGSVDVICSDKTGTLTQNQMSVAHIVPARDDLSEDDVLRLASLCNNAEVNGEGEVVGSATEGAFLRAALDRGHDVLDMRRAAPRLAEIPFSSETKRMATLHSGGNGRQLLIMKGAPDRVLPECQASPEEERERWLAAAEELASDGARVLALADGSIDGEIIPKDVSQHLRCAGLVGLMDPLRPEALRAIAVCRAAGIRAVMITGDHAATARSIARDLGILDGEGDVLTGQQLEQFGEDEFRRRATHAAVFARVSPTHKLRIVEALQATGHSVAMTGDGVNDAPALKQADIGVAMGITGTDVSKEAAAMILADDNFATIVAAVEEGRIVFDNIRKFVTYLLTANASEVIVLTAAVALGYPLPLLPAQLLWINLVTDGLPALALGFEPPEHNVMQRPPRSRDEGLFTQDLVTAIVAVSTIMALVCLVVFAIRIRGDVSEPNVDRARTQVFFILAASQLFYVLGVRSFRETLWERGVWTNWRLHWAVVAGLGLQFLIVQVPFLGRFFHTVPLTIGELAVCLALSLIPLAAVEGWKAWKAATTAQPAHRA